MLPEYFFYTQICISRNTEHICFKWPVQPIPLKLHVNNCWTGFRSTCQRWFGLEFRGAFFISKSESCFRIRIPIPRFIINVKIMILNQANQRSSIIQFETKIPYRSHLWNHLKWITMFLFHIKHVSDFQINLKHDFAWFCK